MKENNAHCVKIIKHMLKKIPALKAKGQDMSAYEANLFIAAGQVCDKIESLSFKEGSSIIGTSLREDFSELDPSEC